MALFQQILGDLIKRGGVEHLKGGLELKGGQTFSRGFWTPYEAIHEE